MDATVDHVLVTNPDGLLGLLERDRGEPALKGGQPMHIGELAKVVGVNPKTIRYYESIGLLPDPYRSGTGYRVYGASDLERLAFIRRAQQLDLSLDEIREVLALRERGERPCGYVLHVARARLGKLDRRIAEMQRARTELHALLQHADDLPDDSCYCRLIEHQTNVAISD